jgi:hypothetical protein
MKTNHGKLYQITSNSEVDTLGPLWRACRPRWFGWTYWDPEPAQALVLSLPVSLRKNHQS